MVAILDRPQYVDDSAADGDTADSNDINHYSRNTNRKHFDIIRRL